MARCLIDRDFMAEKPRFLPMYAGQCLSLAEGLGVIDAAGPLEPAGRILEGLGYAFLPSEADQNARKLIGAVQEKSGAKKIFEISLKVAKNVRDIFIALALYTQLSLSSSTKRLKFLVSCMNLTDALMKYQELYQKIVRYQKHKKYYSNHKAKKRLFEIQKGLGMNVLATGLAVSGVSGFLNGPKLPATVASAMALGLMTPTLFDYGKPKKKH